MKIILILLSFQIITANEFSEKFYNKGVRFDFYETGNYNTSYISIKKFVEVDFFQGAKNKLVDSNNFGYYILKLVDIKGNTIYSRGFSNLFQEWQSTEEAKTTLKSFENSIIFPYPKANCKIEISKRNRDNSFKKVFEFNFNPNSYFIENKTDNIFLVDSIHYSGQFSKCLDIVFIAEGYKKDEMEKFNRDSDELKEYLFSFEPFKNYKDKINIWGIESESKDTGSDIPGDSVWLNTVCNSNYYTFDSERYLMTESYHKVTDIASNAPYDQIFILVNSEKYGGGAIYNFYSTVSVRNERSKKIFIHEFGHGLAGLADEYYTSDVSYQDYYDLNIEPWEANITTLVDFETKWKDLLSANTPIPTPDSLSQKFNIGVYEGGGYVAKRVYRSSFTSIMKELSSDEFNLVSKKALEKVIIFNIEN